MKKIKKMCVKMFKEATDINVTKKDIVITDIAMTDPDSKVIQLIVFTVANRVSVFYNRCFYNGVVVTDLKTNKKYSLDIPHHELTF